MWSGVSCRQRLECVGAARGGHHVAALGHQRGGDGGTESAAGAGDHDGVPLDLEVHQSTSRTRRAAIPRRSTSLGALVHPHGAGLPVVLLDLRAADQAPAAHGLDTAVDHPARGLGGVQLGQRAPVEGLGRVGGRLRCGLVREEPGRLEVRPRVGQQGGHRSVLGEWAAELFAAAGVADGFFERPFHQAHGCSRNGDAEDGEGGQHVTERLAGVTQASRLGEHDVVEGEVAQHVRGDDLGCRPDGEAGGVGRHQQQGVAVGLFGEGGVEAGHAGVGDERLRAVEHQLAATGFGDGGDALEIRPGDRLGQRQRGERLAARDLGEPFLTLLGRARP